ncbi:hypothetical protein DL96DRAFT_1811908 [Flagelloscypha sp. PMI_526]|nr:hypothetical protein DL96DRAFT_1811908 [Flagelloscypha sp. PMI_526]
MALALTTKVDATSAFPQYNGTWHRGGFDGDPHATSYDQSTFLFADVNSSFVTFDFFGFQVDVFGAYRTNDGRYNVYLDQALQSSYRTDPTVIPANDDDTANYKLSLFHWQGTEGHHTPLMNLDLDYVQWFSTVAHLENATIDNPNLSFFQYKGDSWKESASLPRFPAFSNGVTGHWTTTQGASAIFVFKGDRVTLFGVTGPNLAPFTVQVDSGPTVSYSATMPSTTQSDATLGNQVLFTAAGLSQDVTHTLSIVADPQPSQTFVIDYAVVDAVSNSQNASSPSHVSAGGSSLKKGAIAGIAVGAAIVAVLVVAALLFLLRRNKKRTKSDRSAALEGEEMPFPLPYTTYPKKLPQLSSSCKYSSRLTQLVSS